MAVETNADGTVSFTLGGLGLVEFAVGLGAQGISSDETNRAAGLHRQVAGRLGYGYHSIANRYFEGKRPPVPLGTIRAGDMNHGVSRGQLEMVMASPDTVRVTIDRSDLGIVVRSLMFIGTRRREDPLPDTAAAAEGLLALLPPNHSGDRLHACWVFADDFVRLEGKTVGLSLSEGDGGTSEVMMHREEWWNVLPLDTVPADRGNEAMLHAQAVLSSAAAPGTTVGLRIERCLVHVDAPLPDLADATIRQAVEDEVASIPGVGPSGAVVASARFKGAGWIEAIVNATPEAHPAAAAHFARVRRSWATLRPGSLSSMS